MKLLSDIYVFLVFAVSTVFADYACIYNRTNCDFLIKKVSTGCWIFEQQKLDADNLPRFVKNLKDTECLNETIPAKEGFLIRYRYSGKESSEKTSIVLSPRPKLGKEDSKKTPVVLNSQPKEIAIDLAAEEDGTTQQGVYQITQEYSGSFREVDDLNLRKWRHACDKMIIISDENL